MCVSHLNNYRYFNIFISKYFYLKWLYTMELPRPLGKFQMYLFYKAPNDADRFSHSPSLWMDSSIHKLANEDTLDYVRFAEEWAGLSPGGVSFESWQIARRRRRHGAFLIHKTPFTDNRRQYYISHSYRRNWISHSVPLF